MILNYQSVVKVVRVAKQGNKNANMFIIELKEYFKQVQKNEKLVNEIAGLEKFIEMIQSRDITMNTAYRYLESRLQSVNNLKETIDRRNRAEVWSTIIKLMKKYLKKA